jgi:hypothetical protein
MSPTFYEPFDTVVAPTTDGAADANQAEAPPLSDPQRRAVAAYQSVRWSLQHARPGRPAPVAAPPLPTGRPLRVFGNFDHPDEAGAILDSGKVSRTRPLEL